MNYQIGKPCVKNQKKVKQQVETVKNDLMQLTELLEFLSSLTEEKLVQLSITEQLETAHIYLKGLLDRSQAFQVPYADEDYTDPFINPDAVNPDTLSQVNIAAIKHEARRVQKLTNQLSTSLSKIRVGLGEHQKPWVATQEVSQINHVVESAINDLAIDWLVSVE